MFVMKKGDQYLEKRICLFFRFLTLAQKAKVVAFVEISRKLLKALMATQ